MPMPSTANASSLTSLPPEILKYSFEILVESVDANERMLTAMLLSHVCGTFRTLALDCPRLWTCISRKECRPGLPLLNASIERSRDLPLDVVLWAYIPLPTISLTQAPLMLDRALFTVHHYAKRWRRFSMRVSRGLPPQEYSLPLERLSMLHGISLPTLEEFDIFTEPPQYAQHPQAGILSRLGGAAPFYSTWDMPSLRAFSVEGEHVLILPPRDSGALVRLQHLSAKSIWSGWLVDAGSFIVNMASLRSLHVAFNGQWIGSPLAIGHGHIWRFSQITTLHVEVHSCYGSRMYAKDAATSSLFAMVTFPNLISLKISLHVHRARGVYPLHGILVEQNAYPFLETLEIFVDNEDGSIEGAPLVILPHCIVPSLKHLRIQSPLPLVLAPRAGNAHTDSRLHEGTTVPIALQTINLDIPSPRGLTAWVKELAGKMQEQNCWNTFSELVVRSDELDGGPLYRIIPKDSVQMWCDDHMFRWDAADFDWDI